MLYSATENGTKREDNASDRGKTADSVHETSITSQVELPIRAFDWHAGIASF
jgi:hypothetical protein